MDKPFNLLLFDPNEKWGIPVRDCLEKDHLYKVTFLSDLNSLQQTIHSGEFALLIIDLGTNPEEGFTIANQIQIEYGEMPLIFISESPSKDILVEAFRMDADDFVRSPFSCEELTARVNSIINRRYKIKNNSTGNVTYKIGSYYFDTHKQTLSQEDKIQKLTTKEGDLLLLLCQHANQLLKRQQVLQTIWKSDSYFSARSMDVYITKLRKLLSNDSSIAIVNIHGKGYKLVTNQL